MIKEWCREARYENESCGSVMSEELMRAETKYKDGEVTILPERIGSIPEVSSKVERISQQTRAHSRESLGPVSPISEIAANLQSWETERSQKHLSKLAGVLVISLVKLGVIITLNSIENAESPKQHYR